MNRASRYLLATSVIIFVALDVFMGDNLREYLGIIGHGVFFVLWVACTFIGVLVLNFGFEKIPSERYGFERLPLEKLPSELDRKDIRG